MEDINWGEIGLSVVFLAIIAHILYELFFKKKFATYTTDYFRQARIADNKLEYATDKENEEVEELLDNIFNSWSVVEEAENNELREPLKAKQVKGSTVLLKQAIAMCPTDETLVNRLNELTGVINSVNKRIFNGSKTLVTVALVIFALLSLISGTWNSAVYFIGCIVFYILASFTPVFVMDRKVVNGDGGKRNFMTSLIGSLFGTIATAKTVIYKNRNTGEIVDTDNSQTWIAMAFTFFILILVTFLIPIIGLINYIRNYWINI